MDGTFHTLDEHLDDHPNGRCAMAPVLKGWENAGPEWETGSDWLAKQGIETQEKILGKAGAAAYRAGAVRLTDFVGQKQDKDWGSMRYAKSLRDIVGVEGAQKWIDVATSAAKVSHAAEPSWAEWKPDRADAHHVGRCGEPLRNLIGGLAGVKDVYSVGDTVTHYARHAGDFDIARAESLVGQIITDPIAVYRGTNKNSLVFIDWYDDRHYLLVPIKTLPGELWLKTMHIDEATRFHKRKWVREGLLYERQKK